MAPIDGSGYDGTGSGGDSASDGLDGTAGMQPAGGDGITGGDGPVLANRVAAGTRRTCVVLDDGGVKCWGSGVNGGLGYGNEIGIGHGDTPADHGPVDVGGPAVQVVAGFGFACALLEDGSVVCWGATQALGYGNDLHVGDDEVPADVGPVDVGAPVASLSAGSFHVCAILMSGDLKCWGSNGRGQLGLGHTEAIGDDELPSSIGTIDLGSKVRAVGTGFDSTCAWLESGDVRCWGFGEAGRLGQGSTENIGDDELPTDVPPVNVGEGTVAGLTVGSSHGCVWFETGSITCWGLGSRGALGYANEENIGDDELPVAAGIINLGGSATRVWAGANNTCAKLDDGSLKCWGLGNLGGNGYGNTADLGDDELPAAYGPVDLGVEILQLTDGGGEHFCGVAKGGLICWGSNGWGQLGYGMHGSVGNDETPAEVGFVPLVP